MADDVMRRRVWEVQSHINGTDGTPIFTKDMIEKFLNGRTDVRRWAWVIHDKDPADKDSTKTVHSHIHLALEFENAIWNTSLAKDFGLPLGCIRKPKAKSNQFIAIVTYLTHEKPEEQAKGKYLYPDDEIHANFDFRAEINKYREEKKKSKGRRLRKADADILVESIERGELTIDDVKREYGFAFFLDYESRFLKARQEYLKRHYIMLPRINYYIDGPSGAGKTTLAEMLARSLVPELSEDEAYYEVGARRVRFDNYENQPVMIWDDVRASDLINEFGREGVLNLLEVHPKKRNYNIKYGGVILTNQVNIFTGKEGYEQFLDGLAGEYTDMIDGTHHESELWAREQTYRRVPVIIHLHQSDIEVMVNRGVFQGTNEYTYYERWAEARVNMLSINKHYTLGARDAVAKRITAPIVEKHEEFMRLHGSDDKVVDAEDIPEIEVTVGFEACAELREKEREEYDAFIKKWMEKRMPSLKKEASKSFALGHTLEEIARQRVITFEDWLDAGRPTGDEQGYVDTYAQEAQEALERKWKRAEEEWMSAYMDEQRQEMEELFGLWQHSQEIGDSSMEDEIELKIDQMFRQREIERLVKEFEENPSQETFDECVQIISMDEPDRWGSKVLDAFEKIAVKQGYIVDRKALDALITQSWMKHVRKLQEKRLEEIAVAFERAPSKDSFNACVRAFSLDMEDHLGSHALAIVEQAGIQYGFLPDAQSLRPMILQARVDIFGSYEKPDLKSKSVRAIAERQGLNDFRMV